MAYSPQPVPLPRVVSDDLDALLAVLPARIRAPLARGNEPTDLLEVVMDLGREPEARYPGRDLLDCSTQREELLSAEAMRNIRTPTLVINGALDTERRKQVGDMLASRLPNAERKLVANAGHLANLDEPEMYNEIIRQFLVRQARIAA